MEGVIFMIVVASIFIALYVYGHKLCHYGISEGKSLDDEIIQELRDWKQLKIKLVPGKELYSYTLGLYMLYLVYLFLACIALCVEASIVALYTNSGMVFAPLFFVVVFLPVALFSSLIIFPMCRKYAFIVRAIIPCLSKGDILLKKINSFLRKFFMIMFVAAAIITLLPVHSTNGTSSLLVMVIATCASFFFTTLGGQIFVNWELERIGLPNLLVGLQNLIKNKVEKVNE